jgi:outer membrane receptor protein involved in Fe transport
MKLRLLVLATFFVCCLSLPTLAQRPVGEGPIGSIRGTIVEKNSTTPLEFATVAVYKLPDSTLVTGGITDTKGQFNVEAYPGRYFLKVQFISYGETYVPNVVVTPENLNVNVGTVGLAPSDVILKEVVIEGERTQMELQLDKKVYNIGKDLSNLGGSAADLLGNLPSVAVDVEGNVSLRGSENVQILIDGKPSGLIGLSGSGGLQQLQGNMIERVEIITNPSARYDAEGGAGIINIILKKDKATGFNGSFAVNAGYPANYGLSFNINYRHKWVNIFTNYGINYRENPGNGYNNQLFTLPDSTYYTNIRSERLRAGFSQTVRFGADIYLNDKNILTLSTSYRPSLGDNTSNVNYLDYDGSRNFLGRTKRSETQTEDDKNYQYAVNYVREFKRRGQKFTADIQYRLSTEIEDSDFSQRLFPVIGSPMDAAQRSFNDNGEEQWLLQTDYIQPFSTHGRVEMGMRYTYRNIFNDYRIEDEVPAGSGNFEEIEVLTNDFNFDEKVTAGYLMVSNKIDKITWQLGTRLEHTYMATLLEQTGEENSQDYLSLFPSANMSYAMSEELSLQLSYSRRISRPNFRSLNPFVNFTDPRNWFTGNPNLQPQFTDSYELGILNNQKNSSIYYGVYHRHTEGVVSRIQRYDEEYDVTIRRPENMATENAIGVEVNANKDFGKVFRTSGNFNFYNSKIEGEGFFAEATTFSARWSNNYRNDKLFNAQLNIWYSAPQNIPQGKRYSMASVDIGLSRDVMKKNGTVSLNVSDLFNSRRFKGETFTERFQAESLFRWRQGPIFNAQFTYRLNQSKNQRERRRGTDENGRGDMEDMDYRP